MNRILLRLTALVILLMFAGIVRAQQTPAERKTFEQIKARAEKGDAEAQIALAELYAEGKLVALDLAKAAKWHRKSAEQGSAKGQLLLGEDYANGIGVKPDKVEAVKWIRRAAEAGLAEAQFDLGTCYANGEGVKENSVEAVKLFRQASEQDFVDAQYELGKCYLEGSGVSKSIIEGLRLIRVAAEKGFAPAQNSLGLCYARGEGVPKDNLEAYKWFVLAASQEGEHVGDIKVNLAKVERFLTPEQIAEAQRIDREFRPHGQQPSVSSTSTRPANSTELATGSAKDVDSVRAGNEPKYGWINLQAQDLKSEIYVDGDFVGNPPSKLKLPVGSHVIEVKSGDAPKYNRKIMITEGCELTLTL